MRAERPGPIRPNPPGARLVPNPEARLADQCREVMRFRHFSPRTEETYLGWVDRYVRFCRRADGTWRHPRECGAAEVRGFLGHPAAHSPRRSHG